MSWRCFRDPISFGDQLLIVRELTFHNLGLIVEYHLLSEN